MLDGSVALPNSLCPLYRGTALYFVSVYPRFLSPLLSLILLMHHRAVTFVLNTVLTQLITPVDFSFPLRPRAHFPLLAAQQLHRRLGSLHASAAPRVPVFERDILLGAQCRTRATTSTMHAAACHLGPGPEGVGGDRAPVRKRSAPIWGAFAAEPHKYNSAHCSRNPRGGVEVVPVAVGMETVAWLGRQRL